MRIRLQLLLPLVLAGLVGAGFLLVAVAVGGAVRGALVTVPGITVDRAMEAAVRVVGIAGVLVTLAAAGAAAVIARMVLAPLSRLGDAAERPESAADAAGDTRVAEVQNVALGVARAARELRDRRDRAVRELSALEGLVEAVSEGIVQVDPAGRVVRVNPAGRELLRMPEDAVGSPIGALFRNPQLLRLMEAGARGEATEAAEVVVDERRLLVSISPQESGAVATFVDLTDLRRLEEVRRDFVANASHELKTPLTSIRGYTETLMAGELAESEQKQFLVTIARNAERLQRIVDDLLDLSRLEAGRWVPDLELVDVLEAAESSWLAFADRAAGQGVTFSAGTETALPARADRRALEQVFANLYDNALRHTGDGGRIEVTIRSQETEPGTENGRNGGQNARRPAGTKEPPAQRGRWLVAEVADIGSGIPRDALPRIFERFYRVDPARSRAEGGTGLGLSIVRHMMEGMGGGVDARSDLGKGTTLRLWLPVAP